MEYTDAMAGDSRYKATGDGLYHNIKNSTRTSDILSGIIVNGVPIGSQIDGAYNIPKGDITDGISGLSLEALEAAIRSVNADLVAIDQAISQYNSENAILALTPKTITVEIPGTNPVEYREEPNPQYAIDQQKIAENNQKIAELEALSDAREQVHDLLLKNYEALGGLTDNLDDLFGGNAPKSPNTGDPNLEPENIETAKEPYGKVKIELDDDGNPIIYAMDGKGNKVPLDPEKLSLATSSDPNAPGLHQYKYTSPDGSENTFTYAVLPKDECELDLYTVASLAPHNANNEDIKKSFYGDDGIVKTAVHEYRDEGKEVAVLINGARIERGPIRADGETIRSKGDTEGGPKVDGGETLYYKDKELGIIRNIDEKGNYVGGQELEEKDADWGLMAWFGIVKDGENVNPSDYPDTYNKENIDGIRNPYSYIADTDDAYILGITGGSREKYMTGNLEPGVLPEEIGYFFDDLGVDLNDAYLLDGGGSVNMGVQYGSRIINLSPVSEKKRANTNLLCGLIPSSSGGGTL